MNMQAIENARAEALRFIERTDALRLQHLNWVSGGKQYYFNQPKESGAVRRASMDLTRALAEMRKAG